MDKHLGRCGCGKLEYQFEGEPVNQVFCYCHSCQRHSGSDKWFGLWVPLENFSFTRGAPSVYTRLGDSGKKMEHLFCADCGTTVAIRVEIGNFYSVGASTLDDSEGFSPQMLIYTAHAPSWAVFPEGVPRFEILPPRLGGTG
ncbi:GFA family protein [Dongshaea marina]|uniref:GFA family protein n=1 Tax=Dongshaea marina TaxID=2047966 RepID=UPI000D3E50D8|nr:GFA family protein [Dongshaea marina]